MKRQPEGWAGALAQYGDVIDERYRGASPISVLSFGEDQARVNRKSPPLVIIGSAGSGKAALALQKVKDARGDIVCATRSPFRVQCARDIYYAIGLNAIVMC